MINLIYTKTKAKERVYEDCRDFFSVHKKIEWFQDPFIQRVLKTIDRVQSIDGWCIISEDGIAIPPEYLSTGSKLVICVYLFPEYVFNVTQCGNNAFGFIHAICAVQDRTVLTYRYLPEKLLEGLELQKDYEPFNLEDYEELSDEWEKEGLED